MRSIYMYAGIIVLALAGFLSFEGLRPGTTVRLLHTFASSEASKEKSPEEKIREAHERADRVKGLYMTAAVANDPGRPATNLRNSLVALLDTTEANALVIDVKEVNGPEITPRLKPFIEELHRKGVWVIARIATFRDNSEVKAHPEYYFKRKSTGAPWRDSKGHAWMDPMSPGARDYIVNFSRQVTALGFDELQYDYIRFPSDGNLRDLAYTYPKTMSESDALEDFLSYLETNVRKERPVVILSADIFGYVAVEGREYTVGQKLTDMARHFDYLSPMVYPSHYFSGLVLDADPFENLAAISLVYRGGSTTELVSAHQYDVVFRSLKQGESILSGRKAVLGETLATTTPIDPRAFRSQFKAKFRPFLQDFDLTADTARGIYYDAKAVRRQIDAAEAAGAHGWLLWNPSNVYSEGALKPEP